MLLDEAEVVELDVPKKLMLIKKDVVVRDGEKYVKLSPSPDLQYGFTIKFPHPIINTQEYVLKFTKERYKQEISRARTFGFLHEVQYLRSKGLALGGSLDNAIVLDEKKVLNPEGLRYKDEFVRHKILDAIGDMSLIGMNFIGNYEAMAGSHDLNHKLTLALLKDTENYEVVELVGEKTKELEKAYA